MRWKLMMYYKVYIINLVLKNWYSFHGLIATLHTFYRRLISMFFNIASSCAFISILWRNPLLKQDTLQFPINNHGHFE